MARLALLTGGAPRTPLTTIHAPPQLLLRQLDRDPNMPLRNRAAWRLSLERGQTQA
jgi:hypothetical protein